MDRERLEGYLNRVGVRPRGGHRNIAVSCPFAVTETAHSNTYDRNPGMKVLVAPEGRSKWTCFTCDRSGGSLFWLFVEMKRAGVGKVTDTIIEEVKAIEPKAGGGRCAAVVEKPLIEFGPQDLDVFMEAVPQYILDRGFTQATLDYWSVGYDQKRTRAVCPVWNRRGELVGAVGRFAGDHKLCETPKYLDYGMQKGEHLFGQHLIEGHPSYLILVEGPLDVMWMWQLGIERGRVVASMMAKLSGRQEKQLIRWTDRVIALADTDAAGRGSVERMRKGPRDESRAPLASRTWVDHASLPAGQDPQESIAEEIRHAIATAVRI